METILPKLVSFPPHPPPLDPLSDAEYDKQIKALVHTLNNLSGSKLTSGVKGGGDILEVGRSLVLKRSSLTARYTRY